MIGIEKSLNILRRLLKGTAVDRANMLSSAYWRIKSATYYRSSFAEFGSDSTIRRPLLIALPEYIRIGERVHIRDGVRLEVVHDGTGRSPVLAIGNDVNIEQNVHIVCHHLVSIGNAVSITANCAIVDTTHPFRGLQAGTKIGNQIVGDAATVEICEGAFLGIGTIVLPNVRIGRYAVIGAGSIVTHDIPDFSVAYGSPARVVDTYK